MPRELNEPSRLFSLTNQIEPARIRMSPIEVAWYPTYIYKASAAAQRNDPAAGCSHYLQQRSLNFIL
jgi:hypothetical protein